MDIRKKLKKIAGKAAVIGSVAAAVTLTPEAKASHSTDDVSASQKLKDVPEFVVTNPVSEQQAEKVETHTFLEKIKKGEKIEYNGMTFDVPKLSKSEDKDLKKFGFVFENDQVGVELHDDGKSFWGKDKPEKTYKILMPAEDFEGLMNALMDKDLGHTTSIRPENPHDWVYKDKIPHFYTVDRDGQQRNMTEDEGSKAFDMLIDVVCAMNSEGVLDGSAILGKYQKEIEKTDYGWILTGAINAPTAIQNTILAKGLRKSKKAFDKVVKNADMMREEAKKEFEISQRLAIKRYDREQQELAEIAAERSARQQLAEQNRRAQLLIVDSVENLKIEVGNGLGTYLSFNSNGARFDIQTHNGKITNSTVSLNGELRSLSIQPEEWKQISMALDKKLSSKQKKQLGTEFFDLIQQQHSPQKEAKNDAPKKKKTVPTTIIVAAGKTTVK